MIRFLLLFFCMTLPLRAEVFPALYAVTGVATDDVLNIRAEPSAEAPVIGTLAPGATGLEVVAIQDGWAVVTQGERSGYAAIRFLARTNAPDWPTLKVPLTCLGTEPFWSLEIDPTRSETRLRTPEDEGLQTAPMTTAWPGLPWSSLAAVTLPDGLAVLSPADCSDGMSDQSYGIAADLFLERPDRMRLSGCCHLALP